MKKKIGKIVIPIFISILCGFVCGRVMFSIYEDKGSDILDSKSVYLLLCDTYNDYESMKASSISNEYIYYEDEGGYNAIIALTKHKDNIDKIKKAYGKKLTVMEYLLKDDEMNEKISEYDKELENANNDDDVKEIIGKMIGIYKDKEDVKMVKIS